MITNGSSLDLVSDQWISDSVLMIERDSDSIFGILIMIFSLQ